MVKKKSRQTQSCNLYLYKKFCFCTKHEISVCQRKEQNRKCLFFWQNLFLYTINIIQFSRSYWISVLWHLYCLHIVKTKNWAKANWLILSTSPWLACEFEILDLHLLLKLFFFSFLVCHYPNSPHIWVILSISFPFLDPFFFLLPYLFCFRFTFISFLVSLFILLTSILGQ